MNRELWYKKMYNTIHKAKDDGKFRVDHSMSFSVTTKSFAANRP